MDSSPIRVLVQQAWKPEVIIEESEEELEAFNNDQDLPASASPVMKSRIKIVHLQVPPVAVAYGGSRRKRKRRKSIHNVAKTLQFVRRWAKKRKRIAKRQADRDVFRTTHSAPTVRPSYNITEKKNKGHWILNYLPLNPTSFILYWYNNSHTGIINPTSYISY